MGCLIHECHESWHNQGNMKQEAYHYEQPERLGPERALNHSEAGKDERSGYPHNDPAEA